MPGPRHYPGTYFVRRYLPKVVRILNPKNRPMPGASSQLPGDPRAACHSCAQLATPPETITMRVVPCEPNGDGWVGRQGTKIQLRRYGLASLVQGPTSSYPSATPV